MDEKALIRKAAGGSTDAFGTLVQHYQGLVRSVAYSATADPELSEDIAQETFLAAWRGLPTLKRRGAFRPWLCSIARNIAISAVRKRRFAPTSGVPVPVSTPRAEAISAEERRLLWQAVARIPESYRIPLLLYYQEGQSLARVAVVLGISENAAKQRLFRGRQFVRDELASFVESALDRDRRRDPLAPIVIATVAGLPLESAGAGSLWRWGTVWTGSASAKLGALGVIALGLLVVVWPHGPATQPARLGSQTELVAGPAFTHSHQRIDEPAEDALPVDQVISITTAAPETSEPLIREEALEARIPVEWAIPIAATIRRARIGLAKAEINSAWRDQAMAGAPNLCIKGWAYLAMLGDADGKKRLVERTRALDSHSQTANRLLLWYTGDDEAQQYLISVARDEAVSIESRTAAFAAMQSYLSAVDPASVTPPDIEDYYQEQVLNSGFAIGALRQFGAAATTRSTPFLREIVSTFSFGSEKRSKSPLTAAFGYGQIAHRPESAPNECVAREAIATLVRLKDTASCALLHDAALDGFHESVRRAALVALHDLGDKDLARRTLKRNLTRAETLADRIRYAALLARNGDMDSRYQLQQGLKSGDPATRALAYSVLCGLGDDSFVAFAVVDSDGTVDGPNGMHGIVEAGHDLSTFSKQTDERYLSNTVSDYLVRLAECAGNPRVREQALGLLLSASDRQLAPALPIASAMLQEPLATLHYRGRESRAAQIAFEQHMTSLVVILRVGDDEQRERAMARIRQMYVGSDEIGRFGVVKRLGWSKSPDLNDLLARTIKESPRANSRLLAAVYMLAIEAGVVPE